jgi:hypothetical protein
MDIVANIFGSYIPLCCMCAPTYVFFAIAVAALILYLISLRSSVKAEKLAAAEEELPMEKAGSEKE